MLAANLQLAGCGPAESPPASEEAIATSAPAPAAPLAGAAEFDVNDSSQWPQDHWKSLAELQFPGGYPAAESSARLFDELDFHRAVQVYL